MKLGIVTPYDSSNFGAVLQAFATQEFLKEQGHKIYFIKWRTNSERRKLFFRRPLSVISALKYIWNYNYIKRNYKVMTQALTAFDIISIEDVKKKDLDGIIIGSDEVWNIKIKNFQKPHFYGLDFSNDIKKFVYATSSGDATVNDFLLWDAYKAAMSKLSIIGVRDLNTRDLVKQITGEEPAIVCDPTCLVDPKIFNNNSKRIIKEKYLLVYGYEINRKHISYLKRYAKERNLLLVSICMKQKWCDLRLAMSPFEFYSIIKYAECVYTTTFHGTIFTLMQEKKCAIHAVSKKLMDFLTWTNIQDIRVFEDDSYEKFISRLDSKLDYEDYRNRLNQRREYSKKLYLQVLEGIQNGKNL